MHEIHMAEVTEEFVRCWNAAGQHIQNQAQGPLQSWLRAHLNPPFLENLSFRLGNQLFYIRLQDVDDRLDVPGSMQGLLAIADGCAGHACIMPMRKVGADWNPTEPGWGLVDARSHLPVKRRYRLSLGVSTPTNFVCFLAKYFVPQLTGNSLRFSGIRL